jgi:ankyrin repeat protein
MVISRRWSWASRVQASGMTPLHLAVEYNNELAMTGASAPNGDLLVGSFVHSRQRNAALTASVILNQVRRRGGETAALAALQALTQQGPLYGFTALHIAAYYGNHVAVDALLSEYDHQNRLPAALATLTVSLSRSSRMHSQARIEEETAAMHPSDFDCISCMPFDAWFRNWWNTKQGERLMLAAGGPKRVPHSSGEQRP